MNGYNFTERVRKVLAMAREEAQRLQYGYVGTEHILLGLIREGEGVAATVLQNLSVELDDLQEAIEQATPLGDHAKSGPELPYASRAKKVLELAMAEARELNHSYVGTEHLLLGLLREEKGLAAQKLTESGINLDSARAETLRILGTEMPSADAMAREARRVGERMADGPRESGPRFPKRLAAVVAAAHDVAARLGSLKVSHMHAAIAVLEHGEGMANAALDRLGFDRRAAIVQLTKRAPSSDSTIGPEDLMTQSQELISAFVMMEQEQRDWRAPAAGTHHLLLGILSASPDVATTFAAQGIDAKRLRDEIRRISG